MTAASTATYVISLTPFDGAGKTDFSAFRQHLGRMRSAGIGVYVGGGGSGEAHALALDEIAAIAATAAEELRGKVPVRAMGREPRTAAAMIEWANALRDTGVEALQIYSLDAGHGYRPNALEQEAYFRNVLDAIDFPVVLSTHQYNGYLLSADLFNRLLTDYPHVVGINATTPDVRYLAELIETIDGRAELHVGGPTNALTAMSFGATGFLTSEANVAPGLVRAIIDSFTANDLHGMFANYLRFMRLYSLNSRFGSITAIKACLDVLGLPGGGFIRRPRFAVSEPDRDSIRRSLYELNLTDRELGKDQAY
jgi:4-hydroxy-tetrahydrodipicolinate synthase